MFVLLVQRASARNYLACRDGCPGRSDLCANQSRCKMQLQPQSRFYFFIDSQIEPRSEGNVATDVWNIPCFLREQATRLSGGTCIHWATLSNFIPPRRDCRRSGLCLARAFNCCQIFILFSCSAKTVWNCCAVSISHWKLASQFSLLPTSIP